MAYVDKNFRTKKALKEAVKNGENVYLQGNVFGGNSTYGGNKAAVEGPHYPEPHRWYATVTVDENMRVVEVK